MKSNRGPRILNVFPQLGVPGGQAVVEGRGFAPGHYPKVLFGEVEAPAASVSDEKAVVWLPESPHSLGVTVRVGEAASGLFPFTLATRLAGGLHPVTSPVVAPDGTLITTISGARGQQVPQPLVRLTRRGDKVPFPCDIMNPTGLAFSADGQLYITSRHDGTVLRYTNFEHLEVIAEDLGVPCGIVFDSKGFLYVGDRTGRIFRIDPSGNKEEFAKLESSIAAFHMAMDSKDRLVVTGPTFSMRDRLYRFSGNGEREILMEGFARPQGLAFLPDGDLLISAGFQGRKGVFRLSPEEGSIRHFVAAPVMVGIAVAGQELFLADGSSIYRMELPGQSPVN